MREVLESINRDLTKVAIYSNGDERLHLALEKLGISDLFDFVLTSAETGLEKPRAEVFLTILKTAGIKDPGEGKF